MDKSKNIIGVIVALVIGIFFLVRGLSVVIQDFQTGTTFSDLTEAQVTEGTLVEGNLFYVIDYFEEETLSRRSASITLSRMYFIPIEDKFMAIRVDGTQCDTMDRMVEETWKYIEGTKNQLDTVFPMKGKIKAFDDQDRRYAYDYLREAFQLSTDVECDAYLVPYYIDCRYYGKAYIPLGIAAVLLLFAGFDIRKWKKSKSVTYTSYDENHFDTTESVTSPMGDNSKEPVMREDPFEAARREQRVAMEEAAAERAFDEPEMMSSEYMFGNQQTMASDSRFDEQKMMSSEYTSENQQTTVSDSRFDEPENMSSDDMWNTKETVSTTPKSGSSLRLKLKDE